MKATSYVVLALVLVCLSASQLPADYIKIITYPGSEATSAYGYDADNQVVAGSYVDSQGHTLGYTYDVANDAYASVSYPGAASTTLYDSQGGRVVGSYLNPSSTASHAFTSNPGSSSYTALDYPGSTSTVAYTYDSQGQKIVGDYTDDLGHAHSYTYDTQSQSYANIDLPGQVTTYTYDATPALQVGQYTDNLGHNHGFIYDPQTHGLTTVDGPAGNTTVYSYDPLDKIAAVQDVDAQGHTTSYLYDANAGTLTPFEVPGATTTYLRKYAPRPYVAIKSALASYESEHGRFGVVQSVPEPTGFVFVICALVSLAAWRGVRDLQAMFRARG